MYRKSYRIPKNTYSKKGLLAKPDFLNFPSNLCLKRRIQRAELFEALTPGGAECRITYTSTGLAKQRRNATAI
ncbi:hypothetical protein EMIT019CA3_10477 [Bacillus pseudomycoides]